MLARKVIFGVFIVCTFLLQAQTPPSPAAAAPSTEIYVSRSAIALDVKEREPVDTGTVFPPEVKRLYCFTEIKNGAGSEIQHRWYWKDEMITSVTLKVTSNRFRTHSAKSIAPTQTGDWRVAIVNSKDESILKMLNFTVK